jgi:starch synthase (maltosyl-transferring)
LSDALGEVLERKFRGPNITRCDAQPHNQVGFASGKTARFIILPAVRRTSEIKNGPPPPRVVIENVQPSVNDGRFPIKRTVGETVRVTADIFADGHDLLGAVLCYRLASDSHWSENRMTLEVNDRWAGQFTVAEMKPYVFTVEAWIDHFASWRRDLGKKLDAGQEIAVELLAGAELIEQAAARATDKEDDAGQLRTWAEALRSNKDSNERRAKAALDEQLSELMRRYPDRRLAARYDRELPVTVARERARYSAWYEMFPRSCTDDAQRHGRFQDCEKRLEYVASMGFDILYLPPIHPIGRSNRKGRNNSAVAAPDDVGSPWAIGAPEGGHTEVHPELGMIGDLKRLREKAAQLGIELALDLAVQATPDHPLVQEHPEWFKHRPDGSIQYAENPPKKYQDIYPFDFECDDWKILWEHFREVVFFWIAQGIRVFRVDNPHTKPFAFWEWLIAEVRREHPDVLFLAEAFTRPKVMYRLGKLGFDQSYTYFTWRNTKQELTAYMTELARSEIREFYRPNFWPNTPDILPEYLQYGGRAAFAARLVLAATLSSNYGIYGPAFELLENRPVEPGREEYLNSEKYEIKAWEIDRDDSLRDLIARVNQVRREHPALQYNHDLRFHEIENDQLIAYSKGTPDSGNVILTIVNLDPYHTHSGWLRLPLEELGIGKGQTYQAHDLLGNARYFWQGERNFVQLDPQVMPAHIFALRRRVRTERDFDYYL